MINESLYGYKSEGEKGDRLAVLMSSKKPDIFLLFLGRKTPFTSNRSF